MKGYIKTAGMTFSRMTNGGIMYLLPELVVRLSRFIPLIFLWRVLAGGGNEAGMTLPQLLTYTYLNAILWDMTSVSTPASDWCYEGELQKIYMRPAPVYGSIIAETVGGWLPMLALFSLPLAAVAPLFGVSLIPVSIWFFPSLLLCISLGFAIDLTFVCLTLRLRGMAWMVRAIRNSIMLLFSGTVIPFVLLPGWLGRIIIFQPFGSLGGAPLSLFVGTGETVRVIAAQVVWNLLLWPLAVFWLRKSRERMVSYGG